MMVTFISQCEKKALNRTRRVLDSFANRIGDNAWQTVITNEGLNAVRKLLKKTASKNTAVSCHWIRTRRRSELVWVVGNKSKFNEQGIVPTNITRRTILDLQENQWHTAEDITLLAGIAALFHDFGKANKLFQSKIDPDQNCKSFEPYRHEWVSLKLFTVFIRGLDDEQWLQKLSEVQPSEDKIIKDIIQQEDRDNESQICLLSNLPPVAKTVGWLILTHHRLPQKIKSAAEGFRAKDIEYYLDKKLTASWNSPQIEQGDWSKKELNDVWLFPKGTPFKSKTWCADARGLACRALHRKSFYQLNTKWLYDKYTLHLARLSLMLSDHHYSSLKANEEDWDPSYKAFANSDRKTKQLKQKLDEHLIGVYKKSLQLVRLLPGLKYELPSITKLKLLTKPTQLVQFKWQNKAFDIAKGISELSEKEGFFGINIASTGKGKTFANARIMYALSNTKDGCRFSVALGLRTLTLQTGDALKQRLKLAEEDIAILIGSQAVKQLHDQSNEEPQNKDFTGSESMDDLIDETQHVHYDGALSDGPIKSWLEKDPKLNKLVNAPILVSTIDHLMPATEAARGGRQIAPMLRLMSADLVLDEPDDFDITDLPALTRLVNWAGLLGARVLLSSATLPPAIVTALFDAYKEGREHFKKARGETNEAVNICCAWFDEYDSTADNYQTLNDFEQAHHHFVKKRVAKLANETPIHKAEIATIRDCKCDPESVISAMAETVLENIYLLHQRHFIQSDMFNRKISVGLVRMANINPLVALAQRLMSTPTKDDYQFHFCIYHSQHPLIVRSAIEQQLDQVLTRHDELAIWTQPVIVAGLNKSDATHHVFIVVASAVAEVGRDHDYDWAIAEPSSMRSIIQLAGRIQRHRCRPAESANLVLLNTNYRSLVNPTKLSFCQPGFESKDFNLISHQLIDILRIEQYKTINSIPRIQLNEPLDIHNNLADLEHGHLHAALFEHAAKAGASNWWQRPASWTYQLQKQTPFRDSMPDSEYYLKVIEEDQCAIFFKWHRNGETKEAEAEFERTDFKAAIGNSFWGIQDIEVLLKGIAEQNDEGLLISSIKFGAVRLRDTEKLWCYSPVFGIYQALYKSA